MRKISLVLMIFLITLSIFPVTVSATWWDSDYSYRKAIVLTGNTSGAQIDYQLLLNVTYDSDMQSDFDDLRFVNDTHQIDAWLESKVDSSYALVWIKFPTTPADGIEQTFYMYYGKADAVSDWDIGATFIFGDDAEIGAYSTKWVDIVGNGDYSASQAYRGTKSVHLGSTGDGTIVSKNINVDDCVFEAMVKNTGGDAQYTMLTARASQSAKTYYAYRPRYTTNVAELYKRIAGSWTLLDSGASEDSVTTWHKWSILCNGISIKTYFDNALRNEALDSGVSSGGIGVRGAVNANIYLDDVRIRKYVATPATYTFGSKEDPTYIPPNPTNLQNTTGQFWINHTWQSGTGNVTDSYNVSVNNVWHKITTNNYWNTTYTFGNNTWQNITIWAYNKSNIEVLSNNNVSQNTQLYFTNFPTDLQKTYNHTWANWTWGESYIGTHIIDSYNVSVNNTWYNTTIDQYYNHTGLDYGCTSLIIVYGYNNTNGLSIYYVSGSYDIKKRLYKIVSAIEQLVEPLQTMVNKFINIIPFIIAIILFAGFGLAIMTATNKLKKW